MHKPWPAKLYRPGLHTAAVAMVDPAAQANPGAQVPEHAADVRPADDPNTPAGHIRHSLAPASEYCPAGHCTAVALVDPAGQACPALHPPLQLTDARPSSLPNDPAGHNPLHAAEGRPGVAP